MEEKNFDLAVYKEDVKEALRMFAPIVLEEPGDHVWSLPIELLKIKIDDLPIEEGRKLGILLLDKDDKDQAEILVLDKYVVMGKPLFPSAPDLSEDLLEYWDYIISYTTIELLRVYYQMKDKSKNASQDYKQAVEDFAKELGITKRRR